MILNIVLGIFTIVALPMIVALFVKREYCIERYIVINKPKKEIFNYIRFLKNQDAYNKWVMMDPNMKKEFKGIDGTVGFIYAWNGNNKAGEGEQEIKNIVEEELLNTELRFVRPFAGVGHALLKTQSFSENTTKVIWGMRGTSSYPLNLTNLFIPNLLGKDLDISLATLKNVLEK